jgi:hypothetical protein
MKAIRILTIETVLMEKPCIFGHPDMNLFVKNRGIADLYLFDFLLPGGRADAAPCDQ